ncbi:uncharacterized protein LOC130209795 isoform X2 [Pseudoliparis swirei]|uniref:uncharacterized protein LOC130209795 isoform X2 n=1 Tax=Pseudoliparis swirei TaxID=2059687 RepID=UPI0024BE47AF|nr:uncharacterized protein LOC130209795 isoform X2 [Pseudoliparis swirei]
MMIVFYVMLILMKVCRCTNEIIETRTVGVGRNVSLSCPRESTGSIFWISINSGKRPKFLGKTYSFPIDSRIIATEELGAFVLRIKKATFNDTAVYYCIKTSLQKLTFLKATDLRIKEPEPVITAVPPSDRDSVTRKGSVTSVLSDSETKTCPGEHSVCCVRAGAHQYHPSCNFSQGNRVEEHGENPEGLSTKKCISSFLMNVSCSGAGSYYCSVATCEQRFPGNRSKPDTKGTRTLQQDNTIIFLLVVVALAASLIVFAILIYSIKELKKKSCGVCDAAAVLKTSGVSTAGGHQQNQQVPKKSSIGKIVSMYLSLIVLMLSSHNIYHVSILRQMRIYWFILHQSSPLEQKAQIIQKLRRKRVSTLTSGIWGLMNSPNTGFYVCTLWEVNFTS